MMESAGGRQTAASSDLPLPLRKLKTALTNPGSIFRYQSNGLRSFYHGVSRLAHVRTFLNRCGANSNEDAALSIDERKGFAVFSPDQIPDGLAQKVVEEVRAKLKTIDIENIRRNAKKPYLLTVIDSKQVARDSAIYKLISHQKLLNCAARYLKCFPILTFIAVWYSPNVPGDEKGSQKFHLDHEDYRQIKAFLFIEDVGPQNGPFTLLPVPESQKVQKALNYKMTEDNKQIDDEVVFDIVDKAAVKPLTGKAGTLALVDTSRCFHYGSREGTSPRILLTFQYITPFAYVMPWNWRNKKLLPHLHDENMSPSERKLLGLET